MVHSNFSKSAADPQLNRAPILPGLPGGQAWPAWVGQAARAVQEFVASALNPGRVPAQPEDHIRHRPSRKPKDGRARKLRSNRLIISKRVRRKHRRAKR